MGTYKQIQAYVHEHYGYTPETCWIAHVKELNGLLVRPAHNRRGTVRVKPCPPEKQEHIRKAFEHFGLIEISENEFAVVRRAEEEISSITPYPIEFIGSLMDGEPKELYEDSMEEDIHFCILSEEFRGEIPAKTKIGEAIAIPRTNLFEEWNVAPTKEFRN